MISIHVPKQLILLFGNLIILMRWDQLQEVIDTLTGDKNDMRQRRTSTR